MKTFKLAARHMKEIELTKHFNASEAHKNDALRYDPVIKNGLFAVTFLNVTKKYRSLGIGGAQEKLARYLGLECSAIAHMMHVKELEPVLRASDFIA